MGFVVGENDNNRIKLLLEDILDILIQSDKLLLKRLNQGNGITIGYNRNRATNPSVSIHAGKIHLPYPARVDVLILVTTKGVGDDEQMEDLIDATSAVYDELTSSSNRRTSHSWVLVTDDIRWIPIEVDTIPGTASSIRKAYQLILTYQWGGSYD